jgi:hypothetical protein
LLEFFRAVKRPDLLSVRAGPLRVPDKRQNRAA